MNRRLLFLLLVASAHATACGTAGQTAHEESEPAETSASDTAAPDSPAPEDAPAAQPAGEPVAHSAPSPFSPEERPAVCTPPDPAMAPPPRPFTEPELRPLSAEDTGEFDVEIVDHPAIVDTTPIEEPTQVVRDRIARQERYLGAWRKLESSRRFASDEERDEARAALKQQILGE